MSSQPSTPLPPIRVTAVAVSLVSAQGSRRLTSGNLCIGCNQYKLICDQGTLRQDFPDATLSPNDRIILHYRTSQWPLVRKTIQLDIRPLFTTFSASQTQDLSMVQDGIQVVFTSLTSNPGVHVPELESPTAPSDGTLPPTTEAFFDDCPQFRILVIGKSGVGKSSLINIAFGIEKAHTSDLVRGKANIETELKSTVNERFILHDSIGFESGEHDNYKVMKDFIRKRQTGPLKDRLHAIWFCVAIPRAGERLLEVASEDFFQTKKETLGTVPIIVIYTKLDLAVNQSIVQSNGKQSEQRARSQAESSVGKYHEEINRLSGEILPHAAISMQKNYEDTIKNLVKLTHDKVAGVTLIAAQRVDPSLKIKGTIDVGRQRYWKALMASPHFKGHTVWDCLSVIHVDIVAVWNFNDPACHLLESNFKKLIVAMVEKVEIGPLSNPNKFLALGGSSLIAAIPAFLATIANPAAPIVLPIIAGTIAAVWLFNVYQNVPKVQQIFIAYIVHLTHIMEALFILTARHHKKLTRRIIKAAYMTYHNSDLMKQVHAKIQNHHHANSGDTPLQMIESLIDPEQNGNSGVKDYYAKIDKLDLGKYSLDQDEEWE